MHALVLSIQLLSRGFPSSHIAETRNRLEISCLSCYQLETLGVFAHMVKAIVGLLS